MLAYLDGHRPSLVFWENADGSEAVATDSKADAAAQSNVDIVLADLASRGYEAQKCTVNSVSFGLPQSRQRVFVIGILVVASPLLSFEHRSIDSVFQTIRSLIKVCLREAPCASSILYPASDARVAAELERRQKAGPKRDVYDMGKAVKHAATKGVSWSKLRVSDQLKRSPWFATLTAEQRDVLVYSQSEDPRQHLMRDCSQSVKRVRHSTLSEKGLHISPTMMPGQIMVLSEQVEPRLMLGEESLLFNGFPFALMPANRQWTQSLLTDLSGNMVSLPVLLALIQSTLTAVPWQAIADAPEVADDSDVEMALSFFESVVEAHAGLCLSPSAAAATVVAAKRPKTS